MEYWKNQIEETKKILALKEKIENERLWYCKTVPCSECEETGTVTLLDACGKLGKCSKCRGTGRSESKYL